MNGPNSMPYDDRVEGERTTPGQAFARPLVSRTRTMLVHFSLVVFALAIVARAVEVQLVNTGRWTQAAENQQVNARDVAPPRGQILDANGVVLVESRELMRLSFAPKQLKPVRKRGAKRSDPPINTRLVVRKGLKAIGVHDTLIRRVMDTTRKWVELPALYLPSDVERFAGLPGVHRDPVLRRTVLAPPGIAGFLGSVRDQSTPVGGIEEELDSLLRGVSGRNALVRVPRSGEIETPALQGLAARPGHDVSLTINLSLQEIAERELADGIARTGSTGGDVVIMDPRDGAVLAMAGVRNGKPSVTATALAEPYEPGSVMKPFVVTRALELTRVQPDELINTEGGKWTVAKRTINDEHKAAFMSVRDVVRNSSNIGAVKIAMQLSEREEYEALRDFGFGTPTGLPYPAESRGQLPTLKWHPQTASAVAMGYGMSATPLQIAAAYVVLANDGELLQPAIVRQVRDADGTVQFAMERRVVRRVLQPATAKLMRTILTSVVDSGTAVAADMATYDVAGKSGTARRAVAGGYHQDQYNSTFAGMFPAQAPQYVLVVRLIDPKGKIFGGTVAGRIVNEILQAALATRDASLDRRALAEVVKPVPVPLRRPLTPTAIAAALRDTARFDSLRAPAPSPVPELAAPARVVVSLPFKTVSKASIENGSGTALRTVPSVYGLDARQAALTLHAAGFRVSLAAGRVTRTRPAAGTMVRSGSVVVLESPQ
ncbi:MAG: penicillin-binding transpeptidase domain-containing protein [Gemmatimonas sp.]